MPRKRKYRLLRGQHIEQHWEPAKPEDSRDPYIRLTTYVDPVTGKKELRRLVRKVYNVGDTVESELNLPELYGGAKFAPASQLDSQTLVAVGPNRKLMEKMRVDDLRKYAEEEEIDLGSATTKEQIIEAILGVETAPV